MTKAHSAQPAVRPRRPAFKLLAFIAVVGPALSIACSDDGKLLGSDGGAGQTSAGTTSAGSGQGGSTNGGGNSGGTATSGGKAGSGGVGGSSSGGKAGSGGSASCETGACIRANVCLDHCGGTVVYTGCCACEAGTVEELSCAGSGGQGSGGAGSGDCVGQTCSASETCVGYRVVGGALITPDNNGQCEAGKHVEGNTCANDFDYTCATLTGCNAPSATCRCAAGSACANTTICRLPSASAWLDASAELVCELQAP